MASHSREPLVVALRVLSAWNSRQEPDPQDLAILQAHSPEQGELAPDKLASHIRQQAEQWLKHRVEVCKAKYDEAKAAVEMARIERDRGDMPEPDGSQSYRNALVAERRALQAYRKALQDFNALLLDGKVPQGESQTGDAE